MATQLTEVAKLLYELDYRFKVVEDDDTDGIIMLGMATRHYRNLEGEANLMVVISLENEGKYIKIFAPKAYSIPGEKASLFLQACAMIQWRTKLVQYEYDHDDGEIRPIVEFPLEDALLGREQLRHCVGGLTSVVDTYNDILHRVLEEGLIEFDEQPKSTDNVLDFLSGLPPHLLQQALERINRGRN